MERNSYLVIILWVFWGGALTAQNPSPSDFLGYESGSRFTYHHRISDYFKLLTEKNSSRVRLIEYGITYEGRPLIAAIIGSEKNMSRLEEIRSDHLASIGLLNGKVVHTVRPAIAWLSYNVHGDEAVSSEAAMEVMYRLLEPESSSVLENVIIILDPCLNPDGHSRYVGWYNQVKGRVPDPLPEAREHMQPWPGGRYNHYLFDLNRDWAWQVQEESRFRAELYHKWMPHLHADFHEMGSGTTFYFPPAARPFHEDVTAWQREFNTILGEYNRNYFDENKWLYFTKSSFDLFYPSYGDTWPTFNGAIGATYEMGGGGRAGLALARPETADTLTLKMRLSRHVTASKATIEALSAHRERIVREFELFFQRAKEQPVGKFRTYVVKTNGQESRLKPFKELLDRQHIVYGVSGEDFTTQATDFSSEKTARTAFVEGDLLISAHQPKSHLLKILLENSPSLEDSLTYDITSWGLGYVFGLSVYGLEQRREPVQSDAPAKFSKRAAGTQEAYAYVAEWETSAHVQFLSDLLVHNIKVRTTDSRLEAGGLFFLPGALVLTKADNRGLHDRFDSLVTALASRRGVSLTPVSSGMVTKGHDLGSGHVKVMRPVRVGLLGGKGVSPTAFGAIWHFLDQELEYPVTILDFDNMSALGRLDVDVLILADGDYSSVLDDDRVSRIGEWVSAGGKLIAMEGVLHAFEGKKGFDLKKRPEDRREAGDLLKPYRSISREAVRSVSAGAVYEVSMDTSHPIGYGYSGRPYYASIRSLYDLEYLSNGWNIGYLGANGYRSGFVGDKARSRLRNTLIIGVQELGKGKIIYMADHPLFRGFWENGKLLFGNAVFR